MMKDRLIAVGSGINANNREVFGGRHDFDRCSRPRFLGAKPVVQIASVHRGAREVLNRMPLIGVGPFRRADRATDSLKPRHLPVLPIGANHFGRVYGYSARAKIRGAIRERAKPMANVYPNVISLAIIAEGLANVRPRINEAEGFEETTTDLIDEARIAISTLRAEEEPPTAPVSSGTIFVRTALLDLLRSLLAGSLAEIEIAGYPAALDTDYAAAVTALDGITLPPPPPPGP